MRDQVVTPVPAYFTMTRPSGAPGYSTYTGSGVRAKIVCGDYASGYSLFYGVWEFLYEKVVFFFF